MTMRTMRVLTPLLLLGVPMAEPVEANTNQFSFEQVAPSVVFLRVPSTKQLGGQALQIGSSFLVDINERLFLVTAAHLAALMSNFLELHPQPRPMPPTSATWRCAREGD
jgi:hypothetical protein